MNPSEQLIQRIAELDEWRGELVVQLRRMILEAGPQIREEWKWGNPAYSHHGLVFAIVAEPKKATQWVQLTFFQGAALEDPQRLFNAGLDGKTMRYIKFRQGDVIDEPALRELMDAAVSLNAGVRNVSSG